MADRAACLYSRHDSSLLAVSSTKETARFFGIVAQTLTNDTSERHTRGRRPQAKRAPGVLQPDGKAPPPPHQHDHATWPSAELSFETIDRSFSKRATRAANKIALRRKKIGKVLPVVGTPAFVTGLVGPQYFYYAGEQINNDVVQALVPLPESPSPRNKTSAFLAPCARAS